MLNFEEEKELILLRELQKRKDRFLSQEEFDKIVYLQSKKHDQSCTNPSCTGGRFNGKENCPKCGYLLYIHEPRPLPAKQLTIEEILAYLEGLTRHSEFYNYIEDTIDFNPDEDGDWIEYDQIKQLINRIKS